MSHSIILGVENEFSLHDSQQRIQTSDILNVISVYLDKPYFVELRKERGYKLLHCYRFKNGGSFYIDDGGYPEVTSAPSYLFPGSITALVLNLNRNKNALLSAIDKINYARQTSYFLKGWTSHYNFSFQNDEKTLINKEIISSFLMATVNPAIYLFTQYRHSKGLMYRYRMDARHEICGDFLSSSKEMILALSFLALIFAAIASLMHASQKELSHFFYYSLQEQAYKKTKSRPGFVLHLPDILKHGRDALLNLSDPYGKDFTMTAQQYLEFIYEKVCVFADETLNKTEQNLLQEAIFKQAYLPCDRLLFDEDFYYVKKEQTENSHCINLLAQAFGQAIEPIVINSHLTLHPVSMTWERIIFSLHYLNGLSTVAIKLPHLQDFFQQIEQWKSASSFDTERFFNFIEEYQIST